MTLLQAWAAKHNIALVKDPNKPHLISFYRSLDSETLQFVISESNDFLQVDVWTLETKDDVDLHWIYRVTYQSFDREMNSVIDTFDVWLNERQIQ